MKPTETETMDTKSIGKNVKTSSEQNTEEGVNSDARYNLRKRKQINYDDVKRRSARTLYQHGTLVADTEEALEELLEYNHLNTNTNIQKPGMTRAGMYKECVGICMTQMTAKAGIRKHGQDAIMAILKEFGQLDGKKIFKPRHKESLTQQQRLNTLSTITLIKEKRCGRIKGRTCVDG